MKAIQLPSGEAQSPSSGRSLASRSGPRKRQSLRQVSSAGERLLAHPALDAPMHIGAADGEVDGDAPPQHPRPATTPLPQPQRHGHRTGSRRPRYCRRPRRRRGCRYGRDGAARCGSRAGPRCRAGAAPPAASRRSRRRLGILVFGHEAARIAAAAPAGQPVPRPAAGPGLIRRLAVAVRLAGWTDEGGIPGIAGGHRFCSRCSTSWRWSGVSLLS